MNSDSASEVKSWLSVALAKENLQEFSINLAGNSEKGNGFVGDVIFVVVNGTDKKGTTKEYNLVLKCSKSDAVVEKASYLREAYFQEIHIYDMIFPSFQQFQIDNEIENVFDSVAKCYGIFSDDYKQIVVLENLKKIGYDLWDFKNPLPRQHVDLVIQEYAKFHAISIAMKEQQPEKFRILKDGLAKNVLKNVFDNCGFPSIYKANIVEVYNMLKNDLDKNILEKWENFKEEVNLCLGMETEESELNVIVHGDCWNNNFMYKYNEKNRSSVSRVAMLDWQLSRYTSPVWDLSYFLFSCMSPEDVKNMNDILKHYYDTLIRHLSDLRSNFGNQYSFATFLKEWKKYAKFGVMMCFLPIKFSFREENEAVPDYLDSLESGQDISASFVFEMKDNVNYKNRVKPIVQYSVEFGLIK